jgi:hypothetical protein
VFSQKSGISTDHSRSWDISQGHEVARTNPRDRASARLDDKLVKITAPRDIAVQLLLPGYAVVGCDDVQVDHASGSPVLGDVRDFVCRHPFSGDKPLLRV